MTHDWIPTEKQKEALIRTEFEILFGGSRGPGKTDAGMAWLLYDKDNPLYKALVIRRNADDLSDWTARARVMYRGCHAEFAGNPPFIRFPKGGFIKTGHLKDENAYEKYQGHEYQKMLIEELTQIPMERSYLKLISSCRSTVLDIKPQVFATTNPGNAGHKWVKKRFVDVAPPGVPYIDPITGRSRIFIKARVDDNPYLMEKDPNYVHFLEGLPEGLRQAWRDGSWDEIEVEGAYYAKQIAQARRENRITSVPYEQTLKVHTAWDLGVGDSMAIWFFQYVGLELRIIDYFETEGESLAACIKVLQGKPYVYGEHFAPHDIEVREMSSGTMEDPSLKSRKEAAAKLGINFIVVPKLPAEDGIDSVRMMFNKCWFDAVKCKEGIEALENYHKEFDEKRGEYRQNPFKDWSNHAADAFRYLSLGRKEGQIGNYPRDKEEDWFERQRRAKEKEEFNPIQPFGRL